MGTPLPGVGFASAGGGGPVVAGQYVYKPEDYGALGDGATDDLPAFNAMFAAMSAAGYGGMVLLTKTAYFLDGSLALPEGVIVTGQEGLYSNYLIPQRKLVMAGGSTLRNVGISRLTNPKATTECLIEIPATSVNVTLEHVAIVAQAVSSVSGVINILSDHSSYASFHCTLQNVEILMAGIQCSAILITGTDTTNSENPSRIVLDTVTVTGNTGAAGSSPGSRAHLDMQNVAGVLVRNFLSIGQFVALYGGNILRVKGYSRHNDISIRHRFTGPLTRSVYEDIDGGFYDFIDNHYRFAVSDDQPRYAYLAANPGVFEYQTPNELVTRYGASLNLRSKEVEVNLSLTGVTTTVASFLPAAAYIIGLTAFNSVGPGGAITGIDIGILGDLKRFVDSLGPNDSDDSSSFEQTVPLAPYVNPTAKDLLLTASGIPIRGIVRVSLFYFDLTPARS